MTWINGQEWAKTVRRDFLIKSYDEVRLSKDDIKINNDEIITPNITDNDWINKQLSVEYSESYTALSKGVLNNIGERYKFSHYTVDPNKFRLKKVVRILGLVLLFIRNVQLRINTNSNVLIVSESKLSTQFKFCLMINV